MFINLNQEKSSIKSLIDLIPCRNSGIECAGLSGSDRAFLVSRIYMEHRMPVVVVAASSKDAEMLLEDLCFFSKDIQKASIYFPPYNILPFKRLSYHNETAARRISALYRLIEGEMPPVVVTTATALLQRLIPKPVLSDYAELIMTGEDIDRDLLIEKLISGGYVRAAIVEEPGDFCVRGGILDIYSPMYSDPLRIELFGETVESLRFFSAATQRKTDNIQEAIILPAGEAILKMELMDKITGRIREQASALDLPVTRVRELVERIRKEGVFPGIESLIPLIYPKLDTLFNYVSDKALFVLIEPKELEEAAGQFQEQVTKNYLAACKEGRLCVEPDAFYMQWPKAKEMLSERKPLTVKMLPVSGEGWDKGQPFLRIGFNVEDNAAVGTELKAHMKKEDLLLPLANWINDRKQEGYTALIVCSSRLQADRIKSLLSPYGIELGIINGFHVAKGCKWPVAVCLGRVSSGFVWQDAFLAVITEEEIFGVKRHRKKISRQKAEVQAGMLEFTDLKKSEFVVHIEHGVGCFDGLVKLKIDGTGNDFLLIIYKDGDKLYLPVDRMSMVQKYMGLDGVIPVLDKLGSKSWQRVKERVKKSVEKIAGKLLKLYSERNVNKGYAFKVTDGDSQDFEAGFSYEETPDQLKAIDDVLHDMENPIPMDRLICGDVGYGKTEVALRAAFMAVNNGKQVAMLVPTTVLAEQHFETFANRFKRYPVNLACLSRFRSVREQRLIIDELKTGKIDIVIGTHRLIQKDVAFKDLGLVVLDEEQRFGVKHKEKLKEIRRMVDVLTLTATPIPRTLHMSMMGVRDVSIISTPPEHRQSIITYISEFDGAVISEAIRNELKRKGQIYFVHNDIHNIWTMANYLKKLVPEVRLDVAHGRLTEDELELVMLRFFNKEIDMLVCTTIIESGLDIPSANTILINRADRFGLAQIYQLRGRVGRADEQAYAYLFIPDETALGKDAQKRLKVLMEHSDLGAGFQIAMSDLKIRGGGTILGSSQSGHIAAVGYDMFLKLMENAMSELKGKPVQEGLEPEINIPLSSFIPEIYISDINQRLSAYRRLSKMTELCEISDFKKELIDRFGALPKETNNLLLKIMLRVLAIKAGVKRLDLTGQQLILYFSEVHQKHPFGIVDMIVKQSDCFSFTPDHVLKAKLSKRSTVGLLLETKNILKEITQHVNF
ncbi:MAG: transcription-repair coupling factor [Candidatus Desulfaltia sp.]|nr:transcription-repair coupling factor [Candidatus Desulfaltia sp.]